MAEDLTLAAAVNVNPGATRFRIARIVFDWESARIDLTLRAWDGAAFVGAHRIDVTYEGAVATTLMTQLNKVNLATRSLHQRVIDRLIADGKIPAATIGGAPD